jgi:dihydroorotate dehydrogenase (NAD+) catalytic subunit
MMTNNKKPSLAVNVGGLSLKNPVMTASGTFGYGKEYTDFVDINKLGAVIVKGISLKPREGNPPPRIVETPCGMLNSIGLQNVGVASFIEEKLPFLRSFSTPIIVNVLGETVDEYRHVVSELNAVEGISALEVNISCPNVEAGGMAFGTDAESAFKVVDAVRKSTGLTILVKLSPNVTDIVSMARSVADAGADAVSLINTVAGMAVDIETRRPKLANITGGLSGPAIKPVALRMVWEVVSKIDVPVIGVGGIIDAKDALEFLIAGARAIQVGTANFVNPRATMDIIRGIEEYLIDKGIEDINKLIGSLSTS